MELLGIDAPAWVWACVVGGLVVAGLLVVTRVIAVKFSKLAAASRTSLDDILIETLRRTSVWIILACGLWAGAQFVVLGAETTHVLDHGLTILLLFQAGLWVSFAVRRSRDRYAALHLATNADAVTTMTALSYVARVGIWSLFLLMALDNLGFNVTALLAGLGVGGIAVALALQNVLGDLFASLAITIDKPFVVGDFLVLGAEAGSVEQIGLKSTRIRSLSGEQIIISNRQLLDTRIHNFKRMTERRVPLIFGVTYGTPATLLRQIPAIARRIIDETDGACFDRAHFKAFGDYSLTFEVIYYVESADYTAFMDAQQHINLALYEALEQVEVDFAFPTQTLYLDAARAGGLRVAGMGSNAGRPNGDGARNRDEVRGA